MRDILDGLPTEPAPPPREDQGDVAPPDDDDLIRPAVEEELFRVGEHGTLAGRGDAPLAKHLLWTFGPWHRALPFLVQLRVELDGDKVVTVDPEIGWLHQGLEKAFEAATWMQGFDLVERVHAARPEPYLVAWAVAVERLCGIADEVPLTAQLWRTVLLECARLLDHAQVVDATLVPYAPRGLQHAFRAPWHRLAETVSALRAGGDPFRCFGGLERPVDASLRAPIVAHATALAQAANALAAEVALRADVGAPLASKGKITRRLALEHGFTGPALRATGALDDVRMHEPILGYTLKGPAVPLDHTGCALGRVRVRLAEIAASTHLLVDLLDAVAGAPAQHRAEQAPAPPPAGVEVVSLEAPNGELSILVVSDGGPRPARVRLRTPSFPLASALSTLLVGARIDDVVPILESLGLCGTEIDR